jgi:hypothetical protein
MQKGKNKKYMAIKTENIICLKPLHNDYFFLSESLVLFHAALMLQPYQSGPCEDHISQPLSLGHIEHLVLVVLLQPACCVIVISASFSVVVANTFKSGKDPLPPYAPHRRNLPLLVIAAACNLLFT